MESPTLHSPSGISELKLRNGMMFESFQKAYDFYNAYGRQVGFGIRKDYANRSNQTGEITSAQFVCSKEGYREKDKRDLLTKEARAKTRTGCRARMHIKFERSEGIFFIDRFEEEHNHELIRKDCTHFIPSQRNISLAQAIDLNIADDSGLSVGSSYELMGRQVGAREAIGFTKVDQKNYLRTKRQKQLEFGEAGYIFEYFQSQLLENPSFFHAVQLDNEEMITNIFWADTRMIIDYGHFGDVVSFDTTYKVNNANRPLATFVGLNHHRESVIFGAALMFDETADSFVWLFETFLLAMSHKDPRTIITDQDAAIAKALALVMPGTRHHLCTWHIMQNAEKHLGHKFMGSDSITAILSNFMKHHEDEDDFMSSWNSVLTKYDVKDNKWLSDLYDLRMKWAKTYVKDSWTAGMRSTQLSESLNACFKGFLKSDHSIPEFFRHFDRLVSEKRFKELHAEYNLTHKLPKITYPNNMLDHAGEIYTILILKYFEQEFAQTVNYYFGEPDLEEGEFIYKLVALDGYSPERRVRRRIADDYVTCVDK